MVQPVGCDPKPAISSISHFDKASHTKWKLGELHPSSLVCKTSVSLSTLSSRKRQGPDLNRHDPKVLDFHSGLASKLNSGLTELAVQWVTVPLHLAITPWVRLELTLFRLTVGYFNLFSFQGKK